jgi:hypothetical protein
MSEDDLEKKGKLEEVRRVLRVKVRLRPVVRVIITIAEEVVFDFLSTSIGNLVFARLKLINVLNVCLTRQ